MVTERQQGYFNLIIDIFTKTHETCRIQGSYKVIILVVLLCDAALENGLLEKNHAAVRM